jgi:hypothetical protein
VSFFVQFFVPNCFSRNQRIFRLFLPLPCLIMIVWSSFERDTELIILYPQNFNCLIFYCLLSSSTERMNEKEFLGCKKILISFLRCHGRKRDKFQLRCDFKWIFEITVRIFALCAIVRNNEAFTEKFLLLLFIYFRQLSCAAFKRYFLTIESR